MIFLLTYGAAVLYSGPVETKRTPLELRLYAARKGVTIQNALNALNLPESVRTGAFLLDVDTGWALFIWALLFENVETKRSKIMSNQPNPADETAQGNIIPFPGCQTIQTKEALYMQCHVFCGHLQEVADRCMRGEGDETDIIETLEKAIRKTQGRRHSNG